ncbi:MAG: hypothetical protein ABIJ56_15140, partial [Pseudomonadota bacterium]
SYYSQGFSILAAIYQDESGNAATQAYTQSYATRYGFTFPTVYDSAFRLRSYYVENSTPMNMYIDLSTMKILDIYHGWDISGSSMRSEIQYYLSRITR